MKKLLTGFLFLQFFLSCSGDEKSNAASENDLDAARNFLEAALDGKWIDAKKLMLQDSTNVQLLELAEDSYINKRNEEKINLMGANPIIHGSRMLGDSVTVVHYSNSYTNKKDSLRIVRVDGEWLIDLKYSLLPLDTTQYAQ